MKTYNIIVFFVLSIFYIPILAQKHGEKIDVSKFTNNNYITDDTTKVIQLNEQALNIKSKSPEAALNLLEEALTLSLKLKWKLGIGITYNRIAELKYHQGNYITSIELNNKVIEIFDLLDKESKSTSDERIAFFKLSSINNIGLSYKEIGKYTDALIYFNQVLQASPGIEAFKLQASALNNIGMILKEQGDYSKAIECYLKSVRMNESIEDKLGIAINYTNLGNVYWLRKEYNISLDYHNKALDLYKELENKKGMASAFGNIANIYKDQSNYSDALKNYFQSLQINEEIKNQNGIAIQLGNIGLVYQLQKDFEASLEYLSRSLEIRRQINAKKLIVTCLLNIGSSYFSIKKYNEAEKYLFEALLLSDSIGHTLASRNICEAISNLYIETNNYQSAFDYYKRAMNLKDSLFNENKTRDIARLEMNYEFDKKQDSISAIQEKQLAIAELEKSFAIAKAEDEQKLKIAEAEKGRLLAIGDKEKFELESEKIIAIAKADKQRSIAESDKKRIEAEAMSLKQKGQRNLVSGIASIFLLSALFSFFFYKRKRDAEQKQKETFHNLQVSETEMKALRSQMNPHFIFNALQSIQTFLIKHKPDEANMYLLKFSKLMRAVLENSLQSEVSLKKDMQALELYMQLESIRLPNPFTYHFHLDESIDLETAQIPPLILQPFVENAIWHGLQHKPGPGHIDIFIKKNGSELLATVEDNGVGRDMSRKVAQPMLINKESLGMKLTEVRLKILNEQKKINAGFKITDLFSPNNEATGTRIDLVLPAAI